MNAPRYTYTESNAARWKPLFDSLIGGEPERVVPLAGNARSLCSLKVRIGDALKWLADQFALAHNATFKAYAELKPKLRFGTSERGLIIRVRHVPAIVAPPDASKPLNLDSATLARLAAMSQDQKYSPVERERFARVVRLEVEAKKSR